MIAAAGDYNGLSDRVRSYLEKTKLPSKPDWLVRAQNILTSQVSELERVTDIAIGIATNAKVTPEQRARYLGWGEWTKYKALKIVGLQNYAANYLDGRRKSVARRALDDALEKHNDCASDNRRLLERAQHDEDQQASERETLYAVIDELGAVYNEHRGRADSLPEANTVRLQTAVREERRKAELVASEIRAHNLALSYVNSCYAGTRSIVQVHQNLELALVNRQRVLTVFRERHLEEDPAGVALRCVDLLKRYQPLVDGITKTSDNTDAALAALASSSVGPIDGIATERQTAAENQHGKADIVQKQIDQSVDDILARRKQEWGALG